MPSIGLMLFLALFFAIGFGIFGYGLYNLNKSNQAKTWPTTHGKIESCKVTSSSDSDGTSYRVDILYHYFVAGTAYSGQRLAFGYTASNSRKVHQEIADRLTGTKTVLVRYNPTEPTQAVLCYGLNQSTLFFLIFGATWLSFMIGFSALWLGSSASDTAILNSLVVTR